MAGVNPPYPEALVGQLATPCPFLRVLSPKMSFLSDQIRSYYGAVCCFPRPPGWVGILILELIVLLLVLVIVGVPVL